MRKKLTLMFVALFAIAAFAATTWKAAKDTSVEAGTVLVDDDLLAVKTAFKTTLKTDARTIDGQEFTNYIQVRVKADPTVAVPEGTDNGGSTSLIITPKRDVEVTFYYRRQSSSGAYSLNDGKDMKVFDQSDAKAIDAEITLDSETDDGNYAWVTKVCKLSAGKVYTASGRGTTIQFYGLIAQIPFEINTLNFNSLDASFPVSTSNSTDGDIVKDLKFTDNLSGVDVTVTPSTSNTPNRFWSTKNGPQLRIYGGTLTFAAPEGKTISKLTFNNGKWNEGNTADSGEFASNVWTGEAEQVVVTIAGNTQLNSIDVEFATDIAGEPIWTSESAVVVNWSGDVVISPENLAKAKVGDIIHVALKDITATGNWSGQLLPKTAQWIDIEGGIEVVPDMTEITFILTGDMLRLANEQGGLMICGTGFSTDKVTLETTSWTGSDTSIWIGDFEGSGNFGINYSHFKNGNLKAGDIVRVTATEIEGDGHWLQLFSPDWSTCIDAVKTDDGYDITLTDEMISLITADYQYAKINFGNYEITQVELILQGKDVVVDSPAAGDLTEAINKAAAGRAVNNLTINLAANTTYTLSAPIESAGNVIINGADGATIDASGNSGAFIQLSSTPAESIKNKNNYYQLDAEILVKDVEITGVQGRFLYDGGKQYSLKAATIDNCVIALATTSAVPFVAFNTGGINAFTIQNSTIYQTGSSNVNYFVQYTNGARHDRLGWDEATSLTYKNNTFYNVASGNWANGSGMQNYTQYVVEGNIWYESSNGNIARYLMFGRLGGNGATATYSNNTYWKNGAAVDQGSYDASGTSLTTDPEFKDAANGDFTLGEHTDQAKYQTGDPRWLVDYVATVDQGAVTDPIDVTVPANLGEDGAATDLATFLDGYLENSPNPAYIKLTLEGGAEYTISKPIETISAIQILGDESNPATIDASALSGNFVEISSVKISGTPNDYGFYTQIYNVELKNFEVKGLSGSLFSDKAQMYQIPNLTIDNVLVETKATVVELKGSVVENVNVTKSTMNAAAIAFKATADAASAGVTAQTVTASYNTFYQVTGIEIGTATTLSLDFNHNVVISDAFAFAGGTPTSMLVQYNSFVKKDGTDNNAILANVPGVGGTIEGDLTFAAADEVANGNLGLGACPQKTAKIGDPRWLDATLKLNVSDIDDANDLAKAINQGVEDGFTKFQLEENGRYSVKQSIVTDKPLSITGKNVKIDVEHSDVFIQLEKNPTIEAAAPALNRAVALNGTDYIGIDQIALKGLTVTGLKNSIIYDNNTKYCVVDLTIDDCVLGLATEATQNQAFISFQGGGVKDFTMKNSTVYQTGADENNYFLRYNNSARLDRYGYDKETETQSISYINNTFYKVSKNGQWGNYNGIAGQKYSEFHVTGNIWVDCGNGQIARRLLGGRNASSYTTCEFNNNTYWFNEAAETGNTQYDEGYQLTTDPGFKNAAEADFTLSAYSEQAQLKTGDPRWYAEGGHYNPTAIQGVDAEQGVDDGAWYTLQGVRVEKPGKGLYIHNGKTVVVK